MKMLIAALAAAVLFAGCQSTSTTGTPTPPGSKNFKYGTGDGRPCPRPWRSARAATPTAAS